jgi:aspartate/glutamate racemase
VKSYQGCDSVYNVHNIVVTPVIATTNNFNHTGCNKVVYLGTTYTSSTVVRDTVKSYQGCDSIYNIHNIVVTPITATTNNYNHTGCNKVVYLGTTYTNSTIVRDTVKSYQ